MNFIILPHLEVLVPILDNNLKTELLDILQLQYRDTVKARIQNAEESNRYEIKTDKNSFIRSQNVIRKCVENIHAKHKILSK